MSTPVLGPKEDLALPTVCGLGILDMAVLVSIIHSHSLKTSSAPHERLGGEGGGREEERGAGKIERRRRRWESCFALKKCRS